MIKKSLLIFLWVSLQYMVFGQNTVTLHVNMGTASTFNPSIHTVYVSGATADNSKGIGNNPAWPMPGTVSAYKLSDADGDRIYTLTIPNVTSGVYTYKYFYISGNTATWDFGEWPGGNPKRQLEVKNVPVTLQNRWGSLADNLSGKLVINEVMATNNVHPDADEDYEDWLELYNGSAQNIVLSSYTLTDDKSIKNKWVFPAVTIASGQHLLVWASGKDRKSGVLHTNFKINQDNETIYLFAPDGMLADSMPLVSQSRGISYGRLPDGALSWKYMQPSSPGTTNSGNGFTRLLGSVTSSHKDGYYTSSFDIKLETQDQGVNIRYTTDGTDPMSASPVFQSPISVRNRASEPNVFSMIPTNADPATGPPYYEGWQPPLGEVYKINTIKARAFHQDAPPGPVSTFTYIVDPKSNKRYTLPVFSLTTDRKNLFDPETGIYVAGNHQNFKQDWERPAHISFFEQNGTLGFKDNIAIQLNGNTTTSRPRKSIRVMYKDHIGKSNLDYRLFPDKTTNNYKQFILRNSGNDWDFTVFRDGLFQSLAKGMNIETQYYRPSILFINGEYWGIHNVRDKYNDHYIENKYNLSEEEICIVNNDREYKWGNPAGKAHYDNMIQYISTNSMQNSSNYNKVKEWMSIESFVDFQLSNIYVKNTDWPGNNNMYGRYMRPDFDPTAGIKDGRWRWMIFDLDFGFDLPFDYVPHLNSGPTHNTLQMALEPNGPAWPNPSWATLLLRKLVENQEFRHYLVNRYCDLLNTRYAVSHINNTIDTLAKNIEPEMTEHCNRWRRPENLTTWKSNVQALKNFASQRSPAQFEHIKTSLNAGSHHTLSINVSNKDHG